MKMKEVNPVHLDSAVICPCLSFIDPAKTFGAITGIRTSWAQCIAVIPTGLVLTQEKFDRILAESMQKNKPLSEDDVISLFNNDH